MRTFRKFLLHIVCLVFGLLFSNSSDAQNDGGIIQSVQGKTITAIELTSMIDSILYANKIPGLSIAIINDSKIVYDRVFGVKNTITKKPIDENTLFEAASLSKPAFSYFVMKMVEEGLIDLDKPLYSYLPHSSISAESQEDYQSITARMVLSHRSGFPNHAYGEKITLAFKPGTDFLYSGEGYQYLAEVIAHLKKIDIKIEMNALFQKEVTIPLQMNFSTFIANKYVETNKASGHDLKGIPTNNDNGDRSEMERFSAYSSLHSEASEYGKFLVALLEKNGLRKDTYDQFFKEHTHFKESNPLKQAIGQSGWGLGMTQKPTEFGLMHMHTGNNHDFQSYMMILPEKDFGIVFFMNCGKAIPFIQSLNEIIGPIF
jgi:CubicO group peptidase (beta-lactamase class C family)